MLNEFESTTREEVEIDVQDGSGEAPVSAQISPSGWDERVASANGSDRE
jgi:hypothetical protein